MNGIYGENELLFPSMLGAKNFECELLVLKHCPIFKVGVSNLEMSRMHNAYPLNLPLSYAMEWVLSGDDFMSLCNIDFMLVIMNLACKKLCNVHYIWRDTGV